MQEVVPNLFISCLMGARPENVKAMGIGLVINATGINKNYSGQVRVVTVDVRDEATADIHSHFQVSLPKKPEMARSAAPDRSQFLDWSAVVRLKTGHCYSFWNLSLGPIVNGPNFETGP